MEAWRSTFREGVAPLLSVGQLEALRRGLEIDDVRLIQGATTTPPPLACVQDWPCEAACGIGYAYWQSSDDSESLTVADVEEFFARVCFDTDQRIGEPAGVRWFLNWFDDTPRDEMRRQLIPEIDLAVRRFHESKAETNRLIDTTDWDRMDPQDDLTDEQARKAWDEAESIPLSEERIQEIVDYAVAGPTFRVGDVVTARGVPTRYEVIGLDGVLVKVRRLDGHGLVWTFHQTHLKLAGDDPSV